VANIASEIQDPQTFAIIGAALEVHRELGSGFLEPVYRQAFGHELHLRAIPFVRERAFTILDKGQPLDCHYRADLICYESIIVEAKALPAIGGREQSQVINYLKASGLRKGLLLNFGTPKLQVKRIVYDAHLR
jgi:GxxExxY protein